MRLLGIYLSMVLLFVSSSVFAQTSISEQARIFSSSSRSHNAEPQMNTPEWQLTMDVIKSKTESLLLTNEKLMADHQDLQGRFNQIQAEIRDQGLKNESLRQALKEKQGHRDQQERTDELQKQIKAKMELNKQLQRNIDDEQTKFDRFERKVGQKKLRFVDLQVRAKKGKLRHIVKKAVQKPVEGPKDDELTKLNEKLKDEKTQEDILKNQLDNLKQAFGAKQVVDDSNLKDLQVKLETLRKEKEDLQKQGNVDNSQAKLKQYQQLQDEKKQLEDKIKVFEVELDQLKDPENLGIVQSSGKKEALKQMIQLDTLNIQLRQKIADMRQDIELLKEQVSRLERKVQFVKDSVEHK